jgi:hypothetical protein
MLRRKLLSAADAVTYNGPSCRSYLESLGVASERLVSLPYAADDRIYAGLPAERDESQVRERLICVGQLSERKGILPMLEQLAAYCRERPARAIELLLVGDGPLRESIAAVPRPNNLRLEMPGPLPPEELLPLYARCGAAIHPTLADEWLMVADESLHAGLPLIGSRYAQAVETLVRDGHNGWIFDPLVPGEFAAKLDAYFAVPAERLRMMRRAAQRSVVQRTPPAAAESLVRGLGRLGCGSGNDA